MSISQNVVFPGVPAFFRACCYEVSIEHLQFDYSHPGRQLMNCLESLIPYTCQEDEWKSEREVLAKACEAGDRKGVQTWFIEHFPQCMALVPRRRRDKFVDGVLDRWASESGWRTWQEYAAFNRSRLTLGAG